MNSRLTGLHTSSRTVDDTKKDTAPKKEYQKPTEKKINKKILKNVFGNWSQSDGSEAKITFCSFRGLKFSTKHPYQAAHNPLKHKLQRIHTLICPPCVSVLLCTWPQPQQLKICMAAGRNMRQLARLKPGIRTDSQHMFLMEKVLFELYDLKSRSQGVLK